jgi:hypothetical protein
VSKPADATVPDIVVDAGSDRQHPASKRQAASGAHCSTARQIFCTTIFLLSSNPEHQLKTTQKNPATTC